MRYVAFHLLEKECESFGTFEKELKAIDVDLEDWLGYDDETRRMKLDHALEARKMKG